MILLWAGIPSSSSELAFKRKSQHSSRGKNGVWRGARGLAGRAALRPVCFISDTLIGGTE